MKKLYYRRRSSEENAIRATFWSFAGIIFIVVLLTALRTFAPGVFVSLATPFWEMGSGLDKDTRSLFSGFSSKQKLATDNAALSTEIATLTNQNNALTTRDQDLTKLLGGQGNISNGSMILAGVLARPPESAYDTLVVSSGSNAGVVVGAQAFGNGSIPIGEVTTVNKGSSVIQLLSTSGIRTDGWEGENRTPITLTGSGGGSLTASLPKEATPLVGDSVYVPGPGAIPVGTVTEVDVDPSSTTLVVHIRLIVNVFSLTWIQISRTASP
jgi:cell shape-determining protein MreC